MADSDLFKDHIHKSKNLYNESIGKLLNALPQQCFHEDTSKNLIHLFFAGSDRKDLIPYEQVGSYQHDPHVKKDGHQKCIEYTPNEK